MQVGRPGKGTGEPEGSPHRRPNRVAVMTDKKIAAVAGGSSAFSSGFQTRLAMCASEVILQDAGDKCKRKAPTEHLQGAWRIGCLKS